MQNGPTVGRVLLASLHQAIAEVLPARLRFYERWLTSASSDLPDLGIAPFLAMLSYLEQEGRGYDAISARAGHYAAIRSFRTISVLKRIYLRVLPRRLRARKGIGLVTAMLPALYPEIRVELTRRGGTAFLGIDGSPFCDRRHATRRPTCGFISSHITTFLELMRLRPAVRVTRCRASGATSCLFIVLADQSRGFVDAGSAVLGLSDDLMTPSPEGSLVDLPLTEPVRTHAEPVTEPVTEHISVETAPVSVQPEPVDGHPEPVSVDPETLAAQPEPVIAPEPIIVRPQPVRSRADEDPEAPWHRL
jgi:predicted hydrocarbon binding protein